MKKLGGNEIRETFLKFYEEKLHKRLPSASLIPNDPQLLFTVAGMVPFKPIFWGKVAPVFPRVTTCQKCVRTVDIEEVGRTPRHHTFFEMLGNFSFGDYFKRETIHWAWEFITQVLEMPVEKLAVTVYLEDDEAYNIWNKEIGLPHKKITRLGKKDNFWGPAGPTGPCGPDSEIFFDMGEKDNCPDPENCSPACGCGRFLEFYNLVFTESNSDENGILTPLENKNIDTGLGLERLSSILQGVSSNYETDLFVPIIKEAEKLTGIEYGKSSGSDTALRVIADHIRSAVFIISDGVLPSNEGRGYVLKRIIRRALRFGWLYGVKEAFLYRLISVVTGIMGKEYPEIIEKQGFLIKVIRNEEEKFLHTVEQGLNLLDEIIKTNQTLDKKSAPACRQTLRPRPGDFAGTLSGSDVFRMYDTFGFPVEVIQEIASEKGIEIDMDGYEKLMENQRTMAREARGDREFIKDTGIFEELPEEASRTVFTGYEELQREEKVLLIIKEDTIVQKAQKDDYCEVIFAETPFYAEKGGQVTDKGEVLWEDGNAEVEFVFNPVGETIVHRIRINEGELKTGSQVKLRVYADRREETARNHTATHLLHSALRNVLGSHVHQAGSFVNPQRLRFDFSHFQALSEREISTVEEIVNREIMKASPVFTSVMELEAARKKGVTALFDEKYGNSVRVVEISDFSSELCGGTHVKDTGQIGLFKIVSESAISSGVRRIEAVTGWGSFKLLNSYKSITEKSSHFLSCEPSKLSDTIEKNIEIMKDFLKKINMLEEKMMFSDIGEIIQNARDADNFKYVVLVKEKASPQALRNLSDRIGDELKSGVVVIFNKEEEGINVTVKVTKDLAGKRVHAGNLVKKIAGVTHPFCLMWRSHPAG